MDDIFTIQDEIALAITEQLKITLLEFFEWDWVETKKNKKIIPIAIGTKIKF